MVTRKTARRSRPSSRRQRFSRLLVENLEPRLLLAGDVPFGLTKLLPTTGVSVTSYNETLLNTTTASAQVTPAIAASSQGTVVVYASSGQDGSDWGVYGQRFDPSGVKLGSAFRVNVTRAGAQNAPRVAAWEDGRFVVVWESNKQKGDDGWGVYGRLYSADGTAASGEFRINQSTAGAQRLPDVTVLAEGTFAVAWEGRGAVDKTHKEEYELFARQFDSLGAPLTGQIRVNAVTTGLQENAAIRALPSGGFVVAYDGQGPGDAQGIFLRRFSAAATPVNGDLLVNKSLTKSEQSRPTLAVDEDGKILVGWRSVAPHNGWDVHAQFVDSQTGALIGSRIQVNQYSTGTQLRPSAAALSDRSFVVSWEGKSAQDAYGISLRQIAANGTTPSGQVQLNSYLSGTQEFAMLVGRGTSYAAVWDGKGPGDTNGIFGVGLGGLVSAGPNQPPAITAPVSVSLDEDHTLTFSAATSSAIAISDPDAGADAIQFTLAVSSGTLTLANTAGLTFTTGSGAANSSMTFSGSQANINAALAGLVFTPLVQFNGAANLSVSVDDLGHNGSGGSQTTSATVAINVNAINDPPTFGKGADVTVLEDAGPQSFSNWATNISRGSMDEAGQAVQFIVTADSPGLFSQQPTISPQGQLQFTPAADANGQSIITVKLKDDGGGARGGVDTSATETFNIFVTTVNDAPSFLKGPDESVGNSGSPVSIPNWATAIVAGPSDEAGQSLSFLVQSDNVSLFAVSPTISANGTLAFTPQAGANGVSNVSVRLMDGGGTASGGVDTSPAQQFTIAVSSDGLSPALDAALLSDTAPDGAFNTDGITFDPRIGGTVLDDSGVASLTGSIDGGNPLTIAINADGSFVFDPLLERNGSQDGKHTVHLLARDIYTNETRFDVDFVLDTLAPLAPALNLSAASGLVSAQTSSASRVSLVGVTDPGISVALAAPAATALASSTGAFLFDSISLALGDNVFTTTATDEAGNVAMATTTIRRVASSGQTDPVIRWNQTVLQAIRADATNPTFGTRAMAMTQAAIYDAVNAIEGHTGYYVTLPAPAGISLEAAISGAAHQVLSYLFPAQQALFDATLTASLAQVPTGSAATSGVAFGRQVGDAIIALRVHDGWDKYVDYSPVNDPGHWQLTGPAYAPALDPQWATLQPWAMSSSDQFAPPGPPALNSATWAAALNEVESLGAANSTTRTADQTQIARFWSDGAGTASPPGHWNAIAEQAAVSQGNSIAENARLFAMLDIALADAAIVAWNAKYTNDLWRPITAIPNADTDGTDLTVADPNWQSFLITPNFPEYVSGHSTFSAAAATVLDAAFGSNYAFSTTSEGLIGVTRSFASFDAAAAEAGLSRIYGGIHYSFSNEDGQAAGRNLANYVLQTFDTSTDAVAPRVFFDSQSGPATNHNLTISGRALDNLSGVASLTVAIDGGAAAPLAINANGQFSFVTSLATNGTADGSHQVTILATDAAGIISNPATFAFTLDTAAPVLQIDAPAVGSDLLGNATLAGTVSSGNSAIVELKYAFSGQPSFSVSFDPTTGQFSAPLEISKLAPGAQSLTISAKDAAGNTVSTTLNLNLSARVPFTLSSFSPLDGANEVGSTYRPQIVFSRPVNPSSLSANNFYATDPSGAKLPANIVPAVDGTFAWLFFTQPMPGGSLITVHVDGASILAQADSAPLDADGDGAAGGMETFSFSTVSLTPLVGTSLSGKVLDTGTDLKPMTFDDIRAGADGVLHTPDDVFLKPLAGIKVYILGLESQFVLTDANGNFQFDSVPAGDVKLVLNGRTATNAPSGYYFPEMVMDLQLEAGRANTVMGTMGTDDEKRANRDRQEVYLPRLQTSILQTVSAAATTNITVGPGGAPNLSPQQASELTLTVPAGAMRDANGNPLSSAQIGVSTVPASLVRDMLPPGLLQHTFDITVQAPDVATFAAPVAMTFPNTFAALPGTKLNFLSFDHTTGRLVIEGTATVSADGLTVATDLGTGVTHPGWHGLTPQGSPTSPKPDRVSEFLGGGFSYNFTGVTDYVVTRDNIVKALTFSNTSDSRNDGSKLRVVITVPTTTVQYVDGLFTHTFDVEPGDTETINFGFKPTYTAGLTSGDFLIGTRYDVALLKVDRSRKVVGILPSPGTSYLYRYVDASDSNTSDGTLEFADTLADGSGNSTRDRKITYLGDSASRPSLDQPFPTISPYKISQIGKTFTIGFDPTDVGDNQTADLKITTPAPGARVVGSQLKLVGNGVGPRVIYLNKDQFIEQFSNLAQGSSPVEVVLEYNKSLLSPKPTPTFTLTLRATGGNATTRALPLGASDEMVSEALADITAIGPDHLDVRLLTEQVAATATSPAKQRDRYLITPRDGFYLKGEQSFEVKSASLGLGLTTKETRQVVTNLLTKDEIDLLQSPQNLNDIFDGMVTALNSIYAKYSTAVFFSPDAPPGPKGFFNLNWVTQLPSVSGMVAEFPASSSPAVKALLKKLNTEGSNFNPVQTTYMLAQAISRGTHDLTLNHTGFAYVQKFFSPGIALKHNLSQLDLIGLLASTIGHEAAHGLGIEHATGLPAGEGTSEVQKVVLAPGAQFFSLKYAGAETLLLPADATEKEVEDALQILPGLAADKIKVYKSNPGEYFVDFDPNTNSKPRSRFAFVDMAQLVGLNAKVTIERPGHVDLTVKPGAEVVIGGQPGRDDLMRAWVGLDTKLFKSNISDVWLQMSTGITWNANVAKYAREVLTKEAAVTKDFTKLVEAPLPGNDPEVDPDDFLYDGPGLAVTDDTGTFTNDEPLDFGAVAPVSPVTKKLTLFNYGGEPVVIRSVSVTQGFDRFSVPPIPVTTLQPGDSLDVDITFNSLLGLTSTGKLVVDANVSIIGGDISLTGTGQLTNQPAIQVDFYNNLQGQEVGVLTGYPEAQLPLITNVGSAPLTITDIRVAAGQGSDEYTIPHLSSPIVLAAGESTHIGYQFRPSKPGLRPGAFEVLSDDPNTPLVRIPVVTTGVLTQDHYANFDGVDVGNDYVAVKAGLSWENNLPELRVKSDDKGNWNLFLPASTVVELVTYDPVSGLVAHGSAYTNAAGQPTEVNVGQFRPSISVDTDGDGLPDDVEFAIGTNPNRVDTDGDGKNDFVELDTGANPLDDRPAALGVTAALAVGDKAHDVKLAPDSRDASRTLAYVAAGTKGLLVADVTNFASPITIAQLALPGDTNHVSMDPTRKLLAASSRAGGVSFVDISDPSKPILLQTIANSGTDTTLALQLFDGLGYAAMGQKLRVFDAKSGLLVDEFALGDQIVQGMSQSGNRLYLTVFDNPTNQAVLRYLDITATGLVASGSVAIPGLASPKALGEPLVADGIAWFTAGDRVVTVEVVHNFVIKSDATLLQAVANDVQLNGSGLAVASGLVGDQSGPIGSAIVLRTDDPTQVNTIFTRFILPASAEKSALSSGFAYVADGTGGLQLLNFLQLDSGSAPPTIQLDPIVGDIDPVKTGLQFYEGSTVSVPNHITDDVQVRGVELLLNGAVVLKDVSYPYDLATTLPKIATAGPQAVLQVRATDTGGNFTLSAPIVIDLVADATPPAVLSIDPANSSNQPLTKRTVNIDFSEALSQDTVTAGNFVLTGPTGNVTPFSVDVRRADTRVAIVYPPLTAGDYQLTVHAAAVTDRAGNALGASDLTYTFHVGAVAHPPTIRWVNNGDGDWGNPNNWQDVATSAPRLPMATDDVLIDVPADALVTISTSTVVVHSIVSNERLQISSAKLGTVFVGGNLTVTEAIQVNNTFLLNGPSNFYIDRTDQPTFSGTLLPGSGGQGLTLKGFVQLNAATVLTDITFVNDPAVSPQLTLQNGLTLTGTATATSRWTINIDGNQTISSGTFVAPGAATPVGFTVQPIATSTLTLGHDVTMRGNMLFTNTDKLLSVVNQGTLIATGTTIGLSQVAANNTAFTNQGIIRNESGGILNLLSTHFTNTATGKITVNTNALRTNTIDGVLGASSDGATFANAGMVEVVAALVNVMGLGARGTWSSSGAISVDSQSNLGLYGNFTSDDLVNLHSTGGVGIAGTMDNTARTFTFNASTGSIYLNDRGVIKGGTLVMSGPSQRLLFANTVASTLDGVTIQGDIDQGAVINGGVPTNNVHVINGLTLQGTWTARGQVLAFDGAQTITAGTGTGTFQLLPGVVNSSDGGGLSAFKGGPVVIDSSLTFRVVSGGISGFVTNNANIVMDPNSSLSLSGVNSLTPANSGPFDNRANITIAAGTKFGNLTLNNNFINRGSIVGHLARITAGTLYDNFPILKNLGTIDVSDRSEFDIGGKGNLVSTMKTADFGNLVVSSTSLVQLSSMTLDNANATLAIGGGSTWYNGALIVGGTIQVTSPAKFNLLAGTLKDLTLNGNVTNQGGGALAGDITLNGTLSSGRGLSFDDPTSSNLPVRIHSGTIDVQDTVLNAFQTSITDTGAESSIILDAGVVLLGRLHPRASITKPIENHGTIVADRYSPFQTGDIFEFPVGPITNAGILSAATGSTLIIANLTAPSTGLVTAAAGGSVQFTGAFAQAAAGTTHVDIAGTAADKFGLITAAAAATLAGTLDVKFASGYTPSSGDTYKVLTYGSHTGAFTTINVVGLTTGLTVTPQYNSGDVTLVIGGSPQAPMALIPPTDPQGGEGESAATTPAVIIRPSTSTNGGPTLQPGPATTPASSEKHLAAATGAKTSASTIATDRIFADLEDDFLLRWHLS